jgi:hypothetical protein
VVLKVKDGHDEELKSEVLNHCQRKLFCLAAATLKKMKFFLPAEAASK